MSNTTKHTPGPWSVDKDGRSLLYKNPLMGPSRFLAHDTFTEPFKDEQRANMSLIAAAPELLEELQGLVSLIEQEYPHQAGTWLESARAAIAKATAK